MLILDLRWKLIFPSTRPGRMALSFCFRSSSVTQRMTRWGIHSISDESGVWEREFLPTVCFLIVHLILVCLGRNVGRRTKPGWRSDREGRNETETPDSMKPDLHTSGCQTGRRAWQAWKRLYPERLVVHSSVMR